MERSYGIEAGNLVREFIKGPRAVDGVSLPVSPIGIPAAFIIGVSPIAVFLAWAYFGLRGAERSG